MNEPLRVTLSHLPLVGAIINARPEIIAAIVASAISGGILLYGSVQILGTKMDDLSAQLHRVMIVQDDQATRLRSVENETAINSTLLLRGKP